MAQDVRNTGVAAESADNTGICQKGRKPVNTEQSYVQQTTWLSIALAPGNATPTVLSAMTEQCLTIEQIGELSPAELVAFGCTQAQADGIASPDKALIQRALEWQNQATEHCLVTPSSFDFPPLLREIFSPPAVLFAKGNTALLQQRQLALVGSRNPTHEGKRTAHSLARQLSLQGWVVTSGLAMGIDAASHQGALAGRGYTIAVLGTGIDRLYPKRNEALAAQILARNGLIVSEFQPGTAPRPENFPRRNRIVSGLAWGTLVVEAACKSGSLITARLAAEQGREVFAVPGSILNPLTAGTHFLIKQGAKLVSGIEDIHEEFHDFSFYQGEKAEKNFQKKEAESLASDKLLDSVGFEITALDVVMQRSKLPIKVVLAQLSEYELRGLVAAVPGGYIKLGGK